MTRSTVRAVALALLVALAAAPQASAAPTARLKAKVEVDRFIAGKDGIRALGYATAKVGQRHRTRRVVMKVKKGQRCSVLSLSIKRLDLKLLGLNLTTSAINLRVRGDSRRSLGKLFCRLSRQISLGGLGKKARRAVRSLNEGLGERRMPTVGFSGLVEGRQAQSEYQVCEVLDLVIGPVNLDLLGLLVDLYGPNKNAPVRAVVTADPNRGILGERFCELAGGPQT